MVFKFFVLALLTLVVAEDLPTVYEYYTSEGITTGLSDAQPYFTLNGKNITIYSGAMHYFRVPRAYWRDRLKKIRAAGLNAVETYIAWNLHEPQSGVFDFGDGGNDMSDFLHLEEFLTTAQEEDLLVIIRSGPFICAEFEFGGHPSWLLRENGMVFRSSDAVYLKYVTRYFNVLMPILAKYQFTNGGPIIMFQVENEFAIANTGNDKQYLLDLKALIKANGIVELLVTADNPDKGTYGAVPDELMMTGNFDSDPTTQLDKLKSYQPNKPIMVMEYWAGWYDTWGEPHNEKTSANVQENYELILKYPASVNIYMFEGGTNFGFLNGAVNQAYDGWNTNFTPFVTSYDYGSPLSEAGDYTDKYYVIKDLVAQYNPIKTKTPAAPAATPKVAYSSIKVEKYIELADLLKTITPVESTNVVSMENLDINNGNGQSYGYVVYRKTNLDLKANAALQIKGRVSDTIVILVNGARVSSALEKSSDLDGFGTWRTVDNYLTLTTTELKGATLDIVVENWGRVNVGDYVQYKGLWQGDVILDWEEKLTDWEIFPLEFKKSWTNSLTAWKDYSSEVYWTPAVYKATLTIDGEPTDTYVHMENWTKGIVIVNGFVLGRYASMGPEQTLYLPAPLLKSGSNDFVIFEHFTSQSEIDFSDSEIYNLY